MSLKLHPLDTRKRRDESSSLTQKNTALQWSAPSLHKRLRGSTPGAEAFRCLRVLPPNVCLASLRPHSRNKHVGLIRGSTLAEGVSANCFVSVWPCGKLPTCPGCGSAFAQQGLAPAAPLTPQCGRSNDRGQMHPIGCC